MDSFASYADYSEYTDDNKSFYSFLEDNKVSLSSHGSMDVIARRRRRISGIFQLQREALLLEGVAPSVGVPRTILSFDVMMTSAKLPLQCQRQRVC